MANDDDDDDDNDDSFGQDWEELCRGQKYDFQSYVSVDHHVATSGVETVEELCEAFRSTRNVELAFFYAQSGSDVDHGHILGLEKSYFQLRQNSTKKQRIMCDFFC
jgi:hypothetical protein